MPAPIAEIWVCADCHIAHANGEVDPDATCPPWGALPTADVTDDTGPCQSCESQGYGELCNDGVTTFSKSKCDGCGSYLAGERFRYAVWSWETT